ncbi:MAG TPA: non-homologous end-joining DNA ligase [Pyrinomonadaceae bacterium]|jgi:bifunctional non-homologous end joining protein LigD
MGLETYHQKRDFRKTPEPRGKLSKSDGRRFVVQEHHASMLHFDFRLEMGGVLKSWSIRRGPSLDPAEKRLAVPTEDHPVEYLRFQGHIPAGNYGAGEHMIWDEGEYELTVGDDPLVQLAAGKLKFRLSGRKLAGEFNLVRMGSRENQWLLIKSRDEFARPGWKLDLLVPTDDAGGEFERREKAAGRRTGAARKAVVKHGVKEQRQPDSKAIPASRAFKTGNLAGDLNVRAGREAVVSLTHLDKVYWPDEGYTKGDLIGYYYEVSKYILPYLKDRPLIMKRYPDGIAGGSFHQHDVDEAPGYVRTAELEAVQGHAVDYIVGGGLASLLYMANLGAIERHPWHSRVQDPEHPDWLVFDLDPGEGIEFSTICELALAVKDVLDRLGLKGYPKTSGSRGLHVYVPIKPVYSYLEVAELAERIATQVAAENSSIATVERSLKGRKRGQIYLDHMQNARGKSVVAPYSVRPRRGATVSAPLEWSEVKRKKLTIQDFTIKNMLRRIAHRGDLFGPVLTERQDLGDALEALNGKAGRTKAKPSANSS